MICPMHCVGLAVPLLALWLSPSCVLGNSVYSERERVSSEVGDTVTLTCNYSTSSSTPYLFWYRQYPNQIQYILYRGAKSYSNMRHDGDFENGKFSSVTSQTSTNLTITGLTVADSALYLCALSGGAQCDTSSAVLYKRFPLHSDSPSSRWRNTFTFYA
ncbi:hypothetical protein FKM82_023004 [Ascaphus truei]